MAMPLVLIISLLLSLLVLSMLMVVTADYKHGIYQEHKTQAHYLARSSAKTFAETLIKQAYELEYKEMENLLNAISNQTSQETFYKEGSFILQTKTKTSNGQELLEITAKGMYKGEVDTVTVTLMVFKEEGSGGGIHLAKSALVILSDEMYPALEVTGSAYIQGDVIANVTKKNSILFRSSDFRIREGSLYIPNAVDPFYVINTDKGASNGEAPEQYKIPDVPDWQYYGGWAIWKDIENGVKFINIPSYPSASYLEPTFPDDFPLLIPRDSIYAPANRIYYEIKEDGYYDALYFNQNNVITVDLQGGDRLIRVKDLRLAGAKLNLMNVGESSKLVFYVENSFEMVTEAEINIDGDPKSIQIYYAGSQPFKMIGGNIPYLCGNIFVKKANIEITNAIVKGNIITLGENITFSGDSREKQINVYAPNASVYMYGSTRIIGSVIAQKLYAAGGETRLIYDAEHVSQNPLPVDFFSGGQEKISIQYAPNPWR